MVIFEEAIMLLNKERAKKLMDHYKVDALIASSPENVTYVSGYPAPYGCVSNAEFLVVLPRDEEIKPVAISSKVSADIFVASDSWIKDLKLYGEFFVFDSKTPGVDEEAWTPLERRYAKVIRESKLEQDMLEALKKALEERGLLDARLGLDEMGFGPVEFRRLESSLPRAKIVPGYHIFRMIRMVKTEESIEKLRKAARINEKGVLAVLNLLDAGKTEKEMWEVYQETVKREGAIPYHAIFSGGRQGFVVNKAPSDYVFKSGEAVKLDIDCIYAEHYADMAVTAVIGRPGKKLSDYHGALRAGLLKAEEVIRPGITPAVVFNAVVGEVRKKGIPHYSRHHVGHGLGLECYDIPLMSVNNGIGLEEGTVFNIELPYYEIGFGCVHIEHTYLVTKTGCERFQKMSTELKCV